MKFRVLQDHVLVKMIETEEKTPGGILIPDSVKSKRFECDIRGVGPGKMHEGKWRRPTVKTGERVLLRGKPTVEVELDAGETLFCVREDDILGVLEND
jgi:chaperonin GroES